MQMIAICGHCREGPMLKEEDLNDENLKFERELNEKELKKFKEYQQGTANLVL